MPANPGSDAEQPRDRMVRAVGWVAVVALALWLRTHQLSGQILADDEWHALRTAVQETSWEIVTGFSSSAAPTFALLYRWLYLTVGLSELLLRMPLLAFGIASVVLLPQVLPPTDRQPSPPRMFRWLFAALLAISPLLVYFSRYARPYSISLFLAFVAIGAFYRWRTYGRRRDAWLYLSTAVLAPAFHLTTAVSTLAPIPFALAQELWARRRGPTRPSGLAALVRLGTATCVALAAAVGAPLLLDFQALSRRAGTHTPDLLTVRESLPLLAGGDGLIPWVMSACAAVGIYSAARRIPHLVGYLAWIAGVTIVAVASSEANSVHVPIVFLRYSLVILPIYLLFAAWGLARAVERIGRPALGAATAVAAIGLLAAGGPLPRTLGPINNWPHHAIFQYAYRTTSPFSYSRPPQAIPAFYAELGARPPGSVRLVEAPFYYEWHNNLLPYYQFVHRQHVVAGLLGGICRPRRAVYEMPGDPGRIHMHTLIDVADVDALVARGIDYVVLHRDARAEFPDPIEAGIGLVPWTNLAVRPRTESCERGLSALLGEPTFASEWLAVFRVASTGSIGAGDLTLPNQPNTRN